MHDIYRQQSQIDKMFDQTVEKTMRGMKKQLTPVDFVVVLRASAALCSFGSLSLTISFNRLFFTQYVHIKQARRCGNYSPNRTERNISAAINVRRGRTRNFKDISMFSTIILLPSVAMFLRSLIPGERADLRVESHLPLLFHTRVPGIPTFKDRGREER